MRDRKREAEGEAGSTQGARCGTWSRVSRIIPWVEGRRQTAEPPRDPNLGAFLKETWLSVPEFEKENHVVKSKK